MRVLFVVCVLCLLSFSTQTQAFSLRSKAEVVKKYLHEHYPHARAVHQKMISDSLYHVHFIHEDREFFIDITLSGEVLFEEKEMMYNEVPAMIKEYIRYESLYEYGVKIETNDGRVFYFVEIHEGKLLGEYLFDEKGNMLKRDVI